MGKVAKVVLQGAHRGISSGLLLFLIVFTTTSGSSAVAADVLDACRSPIARIVSIQGKIEVSRSDHTNWISVTKLDTTLCAGDRLRSASQSRAALFVQPETLVRIDQSTTIVIGANPEEPVFEFQQDAKIPVSAGSNACGGGYFVTRFPKKFKVRTPHFDAAVEGTEFLVAMRCESTDLSVLEGKVLASSVGDNSFPTQTVTSGQTFSAGGSTPPAIKLLVKPADAVQWTLYYPPITPADTAVVEDCRDVAQDNRASCLIARAERLLRAGRVDEAQANIGDALAVAPYSSDAKALSSIISLVKNDKAAALQLARDAVDASPTSAPAWLALSYAQQADFKLEAALSSAQKSAELSTNALSLARVAELQLSLGWTRDAEKTAKKAVEVSPAESRAHMILAFVHLAQINTTAAEDDFGRAIELDSTEPLSRLGLGLAIIRKGKLVEGREQIEIAVALDPTNSLLRSYVGKAYYEENTKERDNLAATQFALAKVLDPKDPTPWFYDSILAQSQNRSVAALQGFQLSIVKNNNRAVSRSKFLLDDDAAARNASLANFYREIGFEKLAVVASTKSLDEDFGSSSSHRLLAESYFNLPRHDIARVSEALQAQIREPLSLPQADPQLSTDNLAILRDTGPARLGTNEFNLLFNRDQMQLQLDGITGSRATIGDEFVVRGLAENTAFAISQLHYQTEGFLENDAAQKNIQDLFVHTQIFPDASIQMDVKHTDFQLGETFFSFDPTFISPTTILEYSDSFRLGGRLNVDTTADWIWSAIYEDRNRKVESVPDIGPLEESRALTNTAELQNLKKIGEFQIVSGLGFIEQREHYFLEDGDIYMSSSNFYAYGQWHPTETALAIHFGLAAENFTQRNSISSIEITRHEVNPKIGFVWSLTAGTTLRAAAFASVRRPFVASQTIEPTQVAGFNQFFTGFAAFYGDIEGTKTRSAGIALDHKFSSSSFAGIETTYRELAVPSIGFPDAIWRESTGHVYLYNLYSGVSDHSSASHWRAATSMECDYELINRPLAFTGAEGIVELKTIKVPIALRVFTPVDVSIRLATTYVEQKGRFSLAEGFEIFPEEDHAWITDLSIDYQLPRRLGALSIGAKNLFDSKINLVESDPLNRQIVLGRFLFAKARIVF